MPSSGPLLPENRRGDGVDERRSRIDVTGSEIPRDAGRFLVAHEPVLIEHRVVRGADRQLRMAAGERIARTGQALARPDDELL
jgi:hypothetical protein